MLVTERPLLPDLLVLGGSVSIGLVHSSSGIGSGGSPRSRGFGFLRIFDGLGPGAAGVTPCSRFPYGVFLYVLVGPSAKVLNMSSPFTESGTCPAGLM